LEYKCGKKRAQAKGYKLWRQDDASHDVSEQKRLLIIHCIASSHPLIHCFWFLYLWPQATIEWRRSIWGHALQLWGRRATSHGPCMVVSCLVVWCKACAMATYMMQVWDRGQASVQSVWAGLAPGMKTT